MLAPIATCGVCFSGAPAPEDLEHFGAVLSHLAALPTHGNCKRRSKCLNDDLQAQSAMYWYRFDFYGSFVHVSANRCNIDHVLLKNQEGTYVEQLPTTLSCCKLRVALTQRNALHSVITDLQPYIERNNLSTLSVHQLCIA